VRLQNLSPPKYESENDWCERTASGLAEAAEQVRSLHRQDDHLLERLLRSVQAHCSYSVMVSRTVTLARAQQS
jgi:hypothetical protein